MKKTVSLLLAVLLLALCIPGTAFATNETEGTTTVSYTYEPFVDEYIINIPSQYVVTDNSFMEITASKLDIRDYKCVNVYLDPTTNNLDEFIIHLYGQNENSISCQVYVEQSEGPGIQTIVDTSYKVASFNPGLPITPYQYDEFYTTPYQYGRLYLMPEVDDNTPGDTYTGTLHFDIMLEEMH